MRDPEPEPSATTAQFRAFADGRADGEPVPPWTMRAGRSQVMILAAVAVGVAVVLALIALVVIG